LLLEIEDRELAVNRVPDQHRRDEPGLVDSVERDDVLDDPRLDLEALEDVEDEIAVDESSAELRVGHPLFVEVDRVEVPAESGVVRLIGVRNRSPVRRDRLTDFEVFEVWIVHVR